MEHPALDALSARLGSRVQLTSSIVGADFQPMYFFAARGFCTGLARDIPTALARFARNNNLVL